MSIDDEVLTEGRSFRKGGESDFPVVQVRRLKDKASPSHVCLSDRIRSWFYLRNPRIRAGKNIVFKKSVKIRICQTGFLEIGEHSLFHEGCVLLLTMPRPRVEIGRWVFVGMNTIIASKHHIRIGDYTVIAPYCYFIDHEHGFSRSDVILNQRSVLKETSIGRDCYFGTGSIVLGGVSVGDGAIVGAGSVVTQNIPSYEMWAGNPARFIKSRE